MPLAHPISCSLASMRGTPVCDPKDTLCGAIWLLAHYLVYKPVKWFDSCTRLTPAAQFRSTRVPDRKVIDCSFSLILMLHTHAFMAAGRRTRVRASSGLNARLFVSRKYVISLMQPFSPPKSMIKVQHDSRLLCKLRVSRKDPTAVVPGTNSILLQPPPHSCPTYLPNYALLDRLSGNLSNAQTRQRQIMSGGQFTGQSLHLHDHLRGKTWPDGHFAARPQGSRFERHSSVPATSRRSAVGCPGGWQSLYWIIPHRPTIQSLRALLPDMARCTSGSIALKENVHAYSAKSHSGLLSAWLSPLTKESMPLFTRNRRINTSPYL